MASKWLKLCLAAAAAAAVSATAVLPYQMNTTAADPAPFAPDNGTMTILENAPGYGGYNRVWQETFPGNAGELVNEQRWQIITNYHVNNEWQEYTRSNRNMQISGGGTLQIVPLLDRATGKWTSGRAESWYTFTPKDGKVTLAEAKIRFGNAPAANKQGESRYLARKSGRKSVCLLIRAGLGRARHFGLRGVCGN